MSNWTPEERDQEIRHISGLSKSIAVVAVGGTVLLGAGIAWGDQQRIDQANKRATTPQEQPSTTTIQPPTTTPTQAPTPKAPSSGSSSGKSKSGGS